MCLDTLNTANLILNTEWIFLFHDILTTKYNKFYCDYKIYFHSQLKLYRVTIQLKKIDNKIKAAYPSLSVHCVVLFFPYLCEQYTSNIFMTFVHFLTKIFVNLFLYKKCKPYYIPYLQVL